MVGCFERISNVEIGTAVGVGAGAGVAVGHGVITGTGVQFGRILMEVGLGLGVGVNEIATGIGVGVSAGSVVSVDWSATDSFSLALMLASAARSWSTRASTVASTFGVGSAEGTSALEQASMRVPMSIVRTAVSFIGLLCNYLSILVNHHTAYFLKPLSILHQQP